MAITLGNLIGVLLYALQMRLSDKNVIYGQYKKYA